MHLILIEKFKYYKFIIKTEVVSMWRTKMRVRVVVPEKGEDFYMTVEGQKSIRLAVGDEVKRKFPDGWGRAYLVDNEGPFGVIFDHEPEGMERAVLELIPQLGDVLGVPFFEWLLRISEVMGDAPTWKASYYYPSHGVEVEFNQNTGLKVNYWNPNAPSPVTVEALRGDVE